MLTILIRTVILYFLTVIAVRCMGKRQIGELEPSELVVTVIISELATIPIQNPDSPMINSIISILALVAIEIIVAAISMKSSFVRSLISGDYDVIIENGKINQKQMQKANLTVDELFEEIRKQGALDPSEVRLCVIETSGKLSVFLKKDTTRGTLPTILIVDGQIINKNIKKIGINKQTLQKLAKKEGYNSVKDVFLLQETDGKMIWTRKDISK